MRNSTKLVAVGAGAACGWALGRALVTHAAGVATAILSDFEARRTELPVPLAVHRTVRTPSTKLPSRLKTDIELARTSAKPRSIDLTRTPVSP